MPTELHRGYLAIPVETWRYFESVSDSSRWRKEERPMGVAILVNEFQK